MECASEKNGVTFTENVPKNGTSIVAFYIKRDKESEKLAII